MLRKILDYQLSLAEKGKPLHAVQPLLTAGDTFLYEAPINTRRGPHVRDAIDLKRWMVMVVLALLPCVLMAIWNAGMQKMVYGSASYPMMKEFMAASSSWSQYWEFALKDNRWLTILQMGAMAFLPVMFISYAVGGLVEGIFACVRRHEIAEGFLVTGLLYPLVLPPTIPYWMVAVGVAVGVTLSKELFGGTGMNILNPALCCRAFLFFTFPNKMSGDVWVGTNTTSIRESLISINQQAAAAGVDGYSQATHLGIFNVTDEIKRVHVDAIASNTIGPNVSTAPALQRQLAEWNEATGNQAVLGQLSPDQMRDFVTASFDKGGLNLGAENYQAATDFASLNYGIGQFSDWNSFLGNMLGSFGETSVLMCIIGALILIMSGVGSWRVMAGVALATYTTALVFQLTAVYTGLDGGAWNTAKFAFPAYKHLLVGGLAFGLVFMATDPVSGPGTNLGKWIYGAFIGFIVIIIRVINPAFPEGVMLAILLGNVLAPLIDYYTVRSYRRKRRVATA